MRLAAEELAQQAQDLPALADAVRFELGTAEALPAEGASVDLLWCRDVLTHVDDITRVYANSAVLKPDGRAVVYQMFVTDRLEPAEAAWLLPTMGCVAASMRPELTDAAIAEAGLLVDECIVLGTEWGEYSQENSGKPGRNLLHAARLLHEPDRYIGQFGQANYDIALGDCLWHVYRMIGKLSDRVYEISCADPGIVGISPTVNATTSDFGHRHTAARSAPVPAPASSAVTSTRSGCEFGRSGHSGSQDRRQTRRQLIVDVDHAAIIPFTSATIL